MTARSDFRRVLAAESISNFGTMLSRLAIPWLAALSLRATPMQMGWLVVADVAAAAIASVWIGTLVDRLPQKAVMLGADCLRAALFGLLACLGAAGVLRIEWLVAAAAAGGVLTMAFELARSAWMAQSIGASELPARNSQLSAAGSLAETAAFALGGWLYQGVGAALALAADGVSYLVSAACLRGLSSPRTTRMRAAAPIRASLLQETRTGIALIVATPILRTLAALQVLLALGMSLAGTSYMIFVARDLGFAPGVLGMIFATGAVGALVGAAAAPWLGRRIGAGRALTVGIALLALATLWLPLAHGATAVAVLLLVLNQLVGDGGQTLQQVQDRTLRQTLVAPQLLARVDGGLRGLGQTATLLGALAGGAFASAHGTRMALAGAGVAYVIAAVAAHLGFRRPGAASAVAE